MRTLELDVPEWSGHRAGQHLDVRLTAEDGYQAERSYSIASAPEDPLAITVERLEDGEVSPYLVDDVLEGDVLRCAGRSAAASSGAPRTAGHSFSSPADRASSRCARSRVTGG